MAVLGVPGTDATFDGEPKTPKGRRAKARLLDAARQVIGQRGLANTRVVDITDAADMSTGAFYRYFGDKDDVLLALLARLWTETYESSRVPWDRDDPMYSVSRSTVQYMRNYHKHADLMRIQVEAAQSHPRAAEIWHAAREMFYSRIRRSLRRGRDEGVVRDDIDLELAASLLAGMTEHYAYLAYVTEEAPSRSEEEIGCAIADIWARGVYEPWSIPE